MKNVFVLNFVHLLLVVNEFFKKYICCLCSCEARKLYRC